MRKVLSYYFKIFNGLVLPKEKELVMQKSNYPESDVLNLIEERILSSILEGFYTKQEVLENNSELVMETGVLDDFMEELDVSESVAEKIINSFLIEKTEEIWNERFNKEKTWGKESTLYERLRNAFEILIREYDFHAVILGGITHGDALQQMESCLKETPEKPYITFHGEALKNALDEPFNEIKSPYLMFGYIGTSSEKKTKNLENVISKVLDTCDIKHFEYATGMLFIDEPWSKKLKTPVIATRPQDCEWLKLKWTKVTHWEAKETRWGGYPTPSVWGLNKKLVNKHDTDQEYYFLGQVLLPNNKLAFVYTDPDGVLNGDYGNYEDSYPDYDMTPFYQRYEPTEELEDLYDFVIIEGEPLPKWLKKIKGEQEIISEESYTPASKNIPAIPNWIGYEDFPADINSFVFQFPGSFNNGIPSWDFNAMYIWWDGVNKSRLTWQNIVDPETHAVMLDYEEREHFINIEE